MDIPWEDVRLFLAVAETGSLSGAARKLRIGQPTVSRRLAALEYSLGAALFRRSVDGASLTSAGERLLAPARKMAEWAGEVGRAVESSDTSPRGLVRITASPYLCADFLAPFAAWLSRTHPGLRLEVLSSIQYLDLNRGEADLALRNRAPTQEGLKGVLTLEFENAVFVSKSLAAKLPREPRLADLPWIAWAPPLDMLPPNPQLEELIPGFSPVFASDNYLVQIAAAEAGLGAVVMARFPHRFARPSSLVPLSIELGPFARSSLHLVCAKSALDIPRVRRVSELLVSELEKVGMGHSRA
ncbi:LysR family transcriptional regulator [Archangium lipolyticum]|uniref:LysR family transcriptional regulator n=1 Tax=Archangium lipolyticum TaxID=2970465 RepID=UPI0021499EAA|nr:LysR family transcriptional regulator [Archangium lipolyticum]